MFKSFRYRLYPTKAQALLIDKHIGACRFVYNLALETKSYAYAAHGKRLSCFNLINQLPELKEECPWLREVNAQSLQQSIANLDRAFSSFLKGNSNAPSFKSKRVGLGSFRNPQLTRVVGDRVFFPKFKEGIKLVIDRPHYGVIKSSTVSKTPTGKYYISLLCDTGIEQPIKPEVTDGLGIDLGLKDFIVTSDGQKVNNPKHLNNAMSRLKVLQRRASRKQKGSNNRKKANRKVALLHERVTNQRKDFLHKLSTKLISENQALCFEDLNMKGMVKNHNLAGAISGAGWGMFVEMCKYKADWKGKNILFIPTFEPSTKICSCCGYTNHNLTMKDREWTCVCGTKHDRDINAAINIRNYCLRNSGRGTPVGPVELPTLVGALKQEVAPCNDANRRLLNSSLRTFDMEPETIPAEDIAAMDEFDRNFDFEKEWYHTRDCDKEIENEED